MADEDVSYPRIVGLIFIFNLILGTGVLTMPAVFVKAGYILGVIVLVGLCFISFIQTTFIIEAMSNANYVYQKIKHSSGPSRSENSEVRALLRADHSSDEEDDDEDEDEITQENNHEDRKRLIGDSNNSIGQINEGFDKTKIIEDEIIDKPEISNIDHNDDTDQEKSFDIVKKFEIGSMTEMFFSKTLSRAFFISIIIYLYGDVVIYNTMMAKSLREIICTKEHCTNVTDIDHYQCWDNSSITRHTVYQLCVLTFVIILTPLIYAGIKKNQGVQIVTIILRWIAFSSMIGITIRIFALGKAEGQPNTVNFMAMPKLFGICVYAFMCHHSLPSMITPINNKRNLIAYVAGDYLILILIYILVALTGIFAFEHIDDVYTLNFQHNGCSSHAGQDNPAIIPGLDYFLPTFPIFTLFSSYTVIALTLINTMKVLLEGVIDIQHGYIRHAFPMIAILPPLSISLFTEDVSSVVSYVGSYSGGLIQYVFPCLLVYYSRKHVINKYIQPMLLERNLSQKSAEKLYTEQNPFASPFQSIYWVIFTFIWWIISLCLVTADHVIEFVNLSKKSV